MTLHIHACMQLTDGGDFFFDWQVSGLVSVGYGVSEGDRRQCVDRSKHPSA